MSFSVSIRRCDWFSEKKRAAQFNYSVTDLSPVLESVTFLERTLQKEHRRILWGKGADLGSHGGLGGQRMEMHSQAVLGKKSRGTCAR